MASKTPSVSTYRGKPSNDKRANQDQHRESLKKSDKNINDWQSVTGEFEPFISMILSILDNEKNELTTQRKQILSQMENINLNLKNISDKIDSWNAELTQTVEKVDVISDTVKSETIKPKLSGDRRVSFVTHSPPPAVNCRVRPSAPITDEWKPKRSFLSLAESAHEDQKPCRVLFVSDIRNDSINLQQMNPDAVIMKKTRNTVDDATNNIPVVTKPDEVTDVIFHLGTTDCKNGLKTQELKEKLWNMQVTYRNAFPRAKHHMSTIPPTLFRHKAVNGMIEGLCKVTGSNLISPCNPTMHKIESLVDGQEYSQRGIKLLLNEMKKSLKS